MATIIALKGIANSGKTATIRILYNQLIQDGFNVINSDFSFEGGDFRATLSKKEKLIGITSSGDSYDLLYENLQILVNEKCEIIVCACRSYDRIPPGTNAAIRGFRYHDQWFINKVLNKGNHLTINTNYAQRLLNHINYLLSII